VQRLMQRHGIPRRPAAHQRHPLSAGEAGGC
jgi:hypothetical protein